MYNIKITVRVSAYISKIHIAATFAVVELQKIFQTQVLFYKSEGRWFDPRWCHWNYSLT